MTGSQVEFSPISLLWLADATPRMRITAFDALNAIRDRVRTERGQLGDDLIIWDAGRVHMTAWAPEADLIFVVGIGEGRPTDGRRVEALMRRLRAAHADRLPAWSFQLDEAMSGHAFDELVGAALEISGWDGPTIPRRWHLRRRWDFLRLPRPDLHSHLGNKVVVMQAKRMGAAQVDRPAVPKLRRVPRTISVLSNSLERLPTAADDEAFFFRDRTPLKVPSLSEGRPRAPSLFDRP